jgi:hypothetical protein
MELKKNLGRPSVNILADHKAEKSFIHCANTKISASWFSCGKLTDSDSILFQKSCTSIPGGAGVPDTASQSNTSTYIASDQSDSPYGHSFQLENIPRLTFKP